MAMESFNMLMEINMKEIGKMDKDPIKEFMNTQMEISMKDSGKMI